MTIEVKNVLIKSKVNVTDLIMALCSTTVVKDKKVPLFNEDVFDKVKSIDDLWKKLNGLWTIFDYELLDYIIELSNCKEAQDIFKNFFSQVDLSALKNVDLMPYYKEEQSEGSLMPVFRVKVDAKECTLNIYETVKNIIAKVFEFIKCALQLTYIKKGCIELSFYISEPLKLYLLRFVFTPSDMKTFIVHNIVSLCIDDEFELRIFYEVADITVSNTCIASYL